MNRLQMVVPWNLLHFVFAICQFTSYVAQFRCSLTLPDIPIFPSSSFH